MADCYRQCIWPILERAVALILPPPLTESAIYFQRRHMQVLRWYEEQSLGTSTTMLQTLMHFHKLDPACDNTLGTSSNHSLADTIVQNSDITALLPIKYLGTWSFGAQKRWCTFADDACSCSKFQAAHTSLQGLRTFSNTWYFTVQCSEIGIH